jgi:hypothetical protein
MSVDTRFMHRGAKLEHGMSVVRHGGALSPIYRARGGERQLVGGSKVMLML